MIVITKSTTLADRLGASRGSRWLRPSVLAVLTLIALGSIVMMAHGRHDYAALGFLGVVLAALALRVHDVGVRPAQDHLQIGLAGERAVTFALAGLDHRYVLVNGLQFAQPRGELDHLLLGPHGLLGIETKAHGGHITCIGDHWRRWIVRDDGRVDDLPVGNPSAQLARTLRLLAGLLSSWGISCHAEGVIVFTHPQVELDVKDPLFPVVRLDNLRVHIGGLPTDVLRPDEVLTLTDHFRAYRPHDGDAPPIA